MSADTIRALVVVLGVGIIADLALLLAVAAFYVLRRRRYS